MSRVDYVEKILDLVKAGIAILIALCILGLAAAILTRIAPSVFSPEKGSSEVVSTKVDPPSPPTLPSDEGAR